MFVSAAALVVVFVLDLASSEKHRISSCQGCSYSSSAQKISETLRYLRDQFYEEICPRSRIGLICRSWLLFFVAGLRSDVGGLLWNLTTFSYREEISSENSMVVEMFRRVRKMRKLSAVLEGKLSDPFHF